MDQYRQMFATPPQGGTERSGIPTSDLMAEPPEAQPHLATRFASAMSGAQASRVTLGGPTHNNPQEPDMRNYDRDDYSPRRVTHVRVGDVAYEAEKAANLDAEVIKRRDNPPPPLGIPVPVPTDNPVMAQYRSDGKPQPGAREGKPPIAPVIKPYPTGTVF